MQWQKTQALPFQRDKCVTSSGGRGGIEIERGSWMVCQVRVWKPRWFPCCEIFTTVGIFWCTKHALVGDFFWFVVFFGVQLRAKFVGCPLSKYAALSGQTPDCVHWNNNVCVFFLLHVCPIKWINCSNMERKGKISRPCEMAWRLSQCHPVGRMSPPFTLSFGLTKLPCPCFGFFCTYLLHTHIYTALPLE